MDDKRLAYIEELANEWGGRPGRELRAAGQYGWDQLIDSVPELLKALREVRYENGLMRRIIAAENTRDTAIELCTEMILCPRCGTQWECSHMDRKD